MPYIRVNNNNLYYERSGTGPTILTVHGGLGMDHSHIKYSLQFLEKYFEMIYYDQRGHGRSEKIDNTSFVYGDFVDDIEELRKKLSLEDLILLGASAGSYISLMYAKKYGVNIKGLVIEAGYHRYDKHPSPYEILTKAKMRMPKQYERYRTLKEKVRKRGDDVTEELQKELEKRSYFSYFYKFGEKEESFITKMLENTIFREQILRRDVFLRSRLDIDLTKINIPTLILAGKYDLTPIKIAKEMNKTIPTSKLHIFEKSAHFLAVEQPKKYEEILRSWLNELMN